MQHICDTGSGCEVSRNSQQRANNEDQDKTATNPNVHGQHDSRSTVGDRREMDAGGPGEAHHMGENAFQPANARSLVLKKGK